MNIDRLRISHPTDRPNFTRVQFGEVTVWFSYETPIAIASPSTGYIAQVRENRWGQTTGKHLNYINSDKSARISDDEFEALLEKVQITVYVDLEPEAPAPSEVQWPTEVGERLIVLEDGDFIQAPEHWHQRNVYGPGTVIVRVQSDGTRGLTVTEGCKL